MFIRQDKRKEFIAAFKSTTTPQEIEKLICYRNDIFSNIKTFDELKEFLKQLILSQYEPSHPQYSALYDANERFFEVFFSIPRGNLDDTVEVICRLTFFAIYFKNEFLSCVRTLDELKEIGSMGLILLLTPNSQLKHFIKTPQELTMCLRDFGPTLEMDYLIESIDLSWLMNLIKEEKELAEFLSAIGMHHYEPFLSLCDSLDPLWLNHLKPNDAWLNHFAQEIKKDRLKLNNELHPKSNYYKSQYLGTVISETFYIKIEKDWTEAKERLSRKVFKP